MHRYRLSALLAVVALSVTLMPMTASARDQGNPNEDCATGPLVAKFEWKGAGYVFEKPDGGAGVVTITDATSTGGNWTSTVPIGSVIVKGATDTHTDVYSPPAQSGSFSNEHLTNQGGQTPDISNILFCGVDPEPEPGVGTLIVAKSVVGEEPQSATYRVEVNCVGFDIAPSGTFVTDLGAGGSATASTAIPDGTDCTVSETDAGGADETSGSVVVDGGAPHAFSGTVQTVSIGEDTTTTVTFINTFEPDDLEEPGTGTLTVEKVVAGDGAPAADATFAVEVSCDGVDLGQAATLSFGPEGGAEGLGAAIPEGSTCTVTETHDGGADATHVIVDPAADELGPEGAAATVTIADDHTTVVRFTNVFGVTEVLPTGSLVVEKVVDGDGEPAPGTTFEVEVACEGIDLAQAAELTFGAAGGAVELGVAVPAGVDCTATEVEDGGADRTRAVVNPVGDEAGEEGKSGTVTIADGATAVVRLTNTFGTDDPQRPATPSPSPTPRPASSEETRTRDGKDETEVLSSTVTPTRVDAGAGGTATSSWQPWWWAVSLLLWVAVVTQRIREQRLRR